jgi:hypothetical protein
MARAADPASDALAMSYSPLTNLAGQFEQPYGPPTLSMMYASQESVRQTRGIAPVQIPDAKVSGCHGVGGMFAASGTIIFSTGES